MDNENQWDKDVINGAVYKKLLENSIVLKRDITLQWNTDGVQLHKSSKIELWPIQVCISCHSEFEKTMFCYVVYGMVLGNQIWTLFFSLLSKSLIFYIPKALRFLFQILLQ